MTTITCLSFDFEMVKVAYTEASVLMAWIRGGLSQFTDQISSFTKEVLTETTEEVEGRSDISNGGLLQLTPTITLKTLLQSF